MKLLKYLLIPALILMLFSYADADQSIQINKYYQANCGDYTGTWHGFFTDPTDLFGNGGPWPIQVSLYNAGSNIIGHADAKQAASTISGSMTGSVWAQCQNGQLSNIFLGRQNQCGSFSQSGLLVSKNVLVLQINVENAMNGAPLLLFLQRVNSTYRGNIPKNPSALQLKSVESCH